MKPPLAKSAQCRSFVASVAARIVIVALLNSAPVLSVEAQQAASIRVGLRVETASVPTKATNASKTRDSTATRATRTARGALLGAGIGAATGIVAALIATNQANVTDHSEDALAYIALASIGALVGLLFGGIVGFVRE
jgi:hypothetical protein